MYSLKEQLYIIFFYGILNSFQIQIVDLADMREEILSRVKSVVSQGTKYQDSYSTYSYLWVDNRQEFLSQFLLYGRVLTPEEIEQAGDEGVPEDPPTLASFKKQVDSYEAVYLEVEKFGVSFELGKCLSESPSLANCLYLKIEII